MSKEYQKKGLNYRGVKFRTWLYFTLFSCVLLTFICAMQLIMMRAYYQDMKVNIMHDLVVSLEQKNAHDLKSEIRAAAVVGGMERIYYFTTDGERVTNYIGSDLFFDGGTSSDGLELPDELFKRLNVQLMNAVSRMGDRKSWYYADTMDDLHGTPRLNYIERGRNQANESAFYFMQTSLTVADGTSQILIKQLLIVVVVGFVLSLMIAYVLAKHLAQPITRLTGTARKLAKGDYDVKFETCGYAEIDDLALTLNNATEEIKVSDNLRKDLIANISHELRTPLTMIKAYAEMIRDLSGDKPKKREEHLSVIIEETDRLSALVTDILDLSKIQASAESSQNKTVFNLAAMITEVAERFDGMYSPQGYHLSINVTPNAFVIGDVKHIGQVVYNLIANSLNYVGDDKEILISLTEEDNHFYFRVQDHGKGIEAADIPHIWDRYFRSAEAKRTKIGSGIGLSIVKGICEAHNLKYGVNSVPAKGSTFYVVFEKIEPTDL